LSALLKSVLQFNRQANVITGLPHGSVIDMNRTPVPLADELVLRWNAHDDLVKALKRMWDIACREGDVDSETDWAAVKSALAKAGVK